MILVFRQEVAENCALLGCYAESGGNFLPTFRDSLPVPSSRGTAVAQWLRCCATSRKDAGSIPAGVIGIFHCYKIRPIALLLWGRLSL